MKKRIIFLILVLFLASAEAQITSQKSETIEDVYLTVTLINQDPYPANPGDYVTLLFKIENVGTKKAENVEVEIIPSYPFSLDPGVSKIKNIGTVKALQKGEEAVFVKYKLRVDKDAIDGENEIEIKVSYGKIAPTVSIIKKFNVTISDPKTDFEVILQEKKGEYTSFAIMNVGSKTANSVVVKIPEQQNFKIIGVRSYIIGNLDPGDYGFANFIIIPSGKTKNLLMEIHYTDSLGIRRKLQKEVEYSETFTVSSIRNFSIEDIRPQVRNQSNTGLNYILIGITGIIVVLVIILILKKIKKRER